MLEFFKVSLCSYRIRPITSKWSYKACALTGNAPNRFAGVGACFCHSQIGLQNMRAGCHASNCFAGVGTRFYHSQNDSQCVRADYYISNCFAGIWTRFYHSYNDLQHMHAGWNASNCFAGVPVGMLSFAKWFTKHTHRLTWKKTSKNVFLECSKTFKK